MGCFRVLLKLLFYTTLIVLAVAGVILIAKFVLALVAGILGIMLIIGLIGLVGRLRITGFWIGW